MSTIEISPSPHSAPPRWRLRSKVLVGVGATATLVGGLLALDLATNDSRHATTQFSGTVNVLDVDLEAGSLRVVGTAGAAITVDVTVHGGLHRASHSEAMVGDHLRLHADCGLDLIAPSCSADYVVHLPSHVAIVGEANGANINVVGTSGDVDLSINGGNVDMQFASAPRTVKAETNGGKIVIALPNDADGYRVDAEAEGGSTHVGIRTDPASERLIDVHANGGNISVGYLPQLAPS
jgi:hypothetical protein